MGTRYVAFVKTCPPVEGSGSQRLDYLDYATVPARRRSIRLARGDRFAELDTDIVSVAGRWAAADASLSSNFIYSNPTFVFDLASGREAYRVERRKPPGVPGRATDAAAVDSDGRLITVSGAHGCAGRLAYHTRQDPGQHSLPGRACVPAVATDGGRLVYVGRSRGGPALLAADIFGAGPRPVALLAAAPTRFDIEGERIAYATRTCGPSSEIRIAGLSERLLSRPPGACPVRIRSRRLRVSRRGWATLKLRCPRGCVGYATLDVRVRRRSGRRGLRTIGFTQVGSDRRRVTARLRVARKWLKRFRGRAIRGRLYASADGVSRRSIRTDRVPVRIRFR